MKKNQLHYFFYPIIYFLLRTGFQSISNDELKWKESLSIMIISMIVLLFALLLFNWSKTPYDWKKDKDD
ncbi:hypothetical protein U1P98_17855 [Lysinibacillus irui]|uniref:Uncharacterized protein n=1 Tax=Lysinibacillus irui TaxID=2998077 RepID=A0ABU5NQ74_9BACI|nr:hypothetical protein [Lysinibacillus irui]MEA0552249.1 hypothetical protein [Lysinibacillus irui]MEA0978174.1 hypothetical protein [Lysinibacillus irui]MEA1044328.1 hypothetical protein [Lysinibacillus irui]